jgi:hypothetical protein
MIALVRELESEWGVKAGASGRNLGPEDEKLNSLRPGEKTGALTLILEVLAVGGLNWLEAGGFCPMLNAMGWKELFEKLNAPGLKVLVGLNLNSGAATFSFEMDDTLPWLGRVLCPASVGLLDSLSVQGLLEVEKPR